MHERPVPDRDEFLQRIADRLPFDQAEKLDILRELAVHLSDSTAKLEADGLTRDAAERTALERLGPPDRLADSLTEARRSSRRALAAAGAGTYAALGGIVYGYLFTLLVVMGVSIVTVVMAAGPLQWFGGGWASLLDTTTMTVAALGVAAYVAGRKLTATVAARAGFSIFLARPITALVGGSLALAYAVFGWRGALNAPQVVMLLSLPVWFAIGAWRATLAPFPSRRWRLQVVGLALVAVPAALLLGMGQTGSGSGGDSFQPRGVEKIGLPLPVSMQAAIGDSGESGSNAVTGEASMTVAFDHPAVLSGWSDFRVEAWRGFRTDAEFPGDWTVDPDATKPFATAPATLETAGSTSNGLTRLGGSVRIDRNPDVTLAWIATTGVGPDGNRYILEGLGFATTAFNGTVADWLTAMVSGP